MDWLLIVLLAVVGLGLLVVELVFVPGTTIVGIAGLIASGLSVYFAYTDIGTTAGGLVLLGNLIGAVVLGIYTFRSGTWERFAVSSRLEGKYNDEIIIPQPGAEGITISVLRPMGTAEFDGKRFEVRTEGEYLAAGTPIVVSRLKDHRIVFIKPKP